MFKRPSNLLNPGSRLTCLDKGPVLKEFVASLGPAGSRIPKLEGSTFN